MQDQRFIGACRSGDLATVRDILNTYKYAWAVKDEGLEVAVFHKHTDVCRLLLENGANPNGRSQFYGRPLMDAVQKDSMDICKMLIKCGADVLAGPGYRNKQLEIIVHTSRNFAFDFRSPLAQAISYNRIDICRLLLEHGARLHYLNNTGLTMIDYATEQGYHEMCQLLNELTSHEYPPGQLQVPNLRNR